MFESMSSLPHHHHHRRRSMFSRASSASLSDDEDAITPVMEPEPACSSSEAQPELQLQLPAAAVAAVAAAVVPRRSSTPPSATLAPTTLGTQSPPWSRPASVVSENAKKRGWQHFDPAGAGEDLDAAQLWRRMLALQRRFHCYKSARMSAALENEGVQAIVPPRACLDLLNDSIAQLPEEARRQVEDFIENGESRRVKRRSWRRSLHSGGD